MGISDGTIWKVEFAADCSCWFNFDRLVTQTAIESRLGLLNQGIGGQSFYS